MPRSERVRIVRPLLLLALACVLVAGLRDLDRPWAEDGGRGRSTLAYTAEWVHNHRVHGLAVTRGAPVIHVGAEAPHAVLVNWHHPPLYPLLQLPMAAVFGESPWVLRLVHLLLFLPGIPALYLLVARTGGRLPGAVAALLFASCPFVGYFGLMPLQDGITLSWSIVTCWSFQRHLDAPHRHRAWRPAVAFAVCCLNDIPGYFAGVAMVVQALGHRPRAPALTAVARMFAVSVGCFGLTALHYGAFLGGPLAFLRAMLDVGGRELSLPGGPEWLAALAAQPRRVAVDFGAGPLLAMAVLGAAAALAAGPRGRRMLALGLALAMPGLLNYAVFPGHAPYHDYWSLGAFGGLAALAAGLALATRRRAPAPMGWRARLAFVAVLATAAGGAIQTWHLSARQAADPSGDHVRIAALAPDLGDCEFVLTSADIALGRPFGTTFFVGGVKTRGSFDGLLELARANGLSANAAFVLTPGCYGSPLRDRLEQLGTGTPVAGALVYRFRLSGLPVSAVRR